jgi:histidinol dehydrogenase
MELVRTTGLAGRRGRARIATLVDRRDSMDRRTTPLVERILNTVRKDGDRALRHFAANFDGLAPTQALRVTEAEMQASLAAIPTTLQRALEQAATNIRAFAERQMPVDWDIEPMAGLSTGQRVRPLDSVGCYVPSGRHPLPSTLLMTVIPAEVAGVRRIVVVSPKPADATLAAAALLGGAAAGIEFYRLGGAQAIAALAYGTQTIARVDKIVGPGNAFVTTAKRLVSSTGDTAIDMLAGPTEIIVASEHGAPAAIAADLVAQAEHDPEAVAIFITATPSLARAVIAEAKQQARANPIAALSLARNGVAIVAASVDEARSITNLLAGEHLSVDDPRDLGWVRHAGSVFVGRYSPQPMGDYVSGPNHTLPTGGQARLRGGLSVHDYLKLITVQQYTAEGLAALAPPAIELAEAEGLSGHAEAIRARLQVSLHDERGKRG